MMGIVPEKGACVDPVPVLNSFRSLAKCGKVKDGSPPGHTDGWGAVTWNSDDLPYYLAREPKNASTDIAFDEMLSTLERFSIRSHVVAHLRKASLGSKTVENTHPFIIGNWAFAHNGTIRKLNLKDRTDSEWFFKSLMAEYAPGQPDMLAAIKKRIDLVHHMYNYSSMTFLLSNGREMFAYRDYAKDKEYYTLYYAKAKNYHLLCQEKIVDDFEWIEIENKHLLHIYDGRVSNLDLSERSTLLA